MPGGLIGQLQAGPHREPPVRGSERVHPTSSDHSIEWPPAPPRPIDLLMASPPRRLRLRRADQCVDCASDLPAGDVAVWDETARTVTCVHCAGTATPADVAGASAQARYDKHRADREARIHGRYGRIGVGISRLTREPQHAVAWKRGAEGERRAGVRFEKFLDLNEVELLHDRRIPGARSNIDHIVVAASGVTVIDAKNIRGPVRVLTTRGRATRRGERLQVNGRDRTKLVDGVERQVAAVEAALQGAGLEHVPVSGALCWVQTAWLPGLRTRWVRSVAIDGPKPIAKAIRRRGPHDHSDVLDVAAVLRGALPPSG